MKIGSNVPFRRVESHNFFPIHLVIFRRGRHPEIRVPNWVTGREDGLVIQRWTIPCRERKADGAKKGGGGVAGWCGDRMLPGARRFTGENGDGDWSRMRQWGGPPRLFALLLTA